MFFKDYIEAGYDSTREDLVYSMTRDDIWKNEVKVEGSSFW